MRPLRKLTLAATLAALAAACDVGGPARDTGASQAVAVAVEPPEVTVVTGGDVHFAATVTGSVDTGVVWAVVEEGGGSIGAAGLYTAPASAGTFRVRATASEDPEAFAESVVTVRPAVAVAITPSPAAANTCKTLTFTANVTGTTDRAVTWSVQEGAAGGTITSAGVYTAPATAGSYHVVGTSRADPTKRAVSTVTVTNRVLSIALSPQQVSVAPGGTAQFTASVTTSCGTFSSTRTLTAPDG